MEIGIAPGMRVMLSVDGEPLCRGARSIECALPHARLKARSTTGDQQEFLLKWIEAANKRIEEDDLNARVESEYAKEYSSVEKYAKKLPDYARQPAEDFMRERIRKRLDPK